MEQQMERRRRSRTRCSPGSRPNPDSVRKLMDGMQTGRAEMLKLEQDQNREMASYLTPVQQAAYQADARAVMQRVGELRMQRREGQGWAEDGDGLVAGNPPRTASPGDLSSGCSSGSE